MKVLLSWLREYCPTSLSPEEIATALTEHGVEVEAVLRPWERLGGVITARVVDVRDHPNADKLCLATVDTGAGQREVVVGVRNMGPDDVVPYAPPGATLPGFEGELEKRKIRGETSDGMLCSPKELGISGDHAGILVLDEDAEPGADVKELLGLDDAVIDVEVFPNRPDLLSVVGVAREVAAATGDDLRPPDTKVAEVKRKASEAATVEVRDEERCPRYLARVIEGVQVGPSPLGVQIRLSACGMRPLSNVVDATNYVLLEMGHPLHPFDLKGLEGRGIVVRRAEDGERLVTLDEEERTLAGDDLVIADHGRGVAIAGAMGSSAAEVGPGTTDVLLESAYFQPLGVLLTARRLGLRTEASIRFERGADPEAVAPAAARAAALMAAWSGGSVLAGEVDVGSVPDRKTVSVRPARATALLGMDVSAKDIREAFGRLRLTSAEKKDRVNVEVPGYRVDLEREADLIEEVARVRGYDTIPSSLPGVRMAGGLSSEQRTRRRIRDTLVQAGLVETISSSFASPADLTLFEDERRQGVAMANPVSEDEGFLRSSLIPGLLRAGALNAGHRRNAVRLFEMAHVFRAGDPDPVERERVTALVTGPVGEEWPAERRDRDFLDAKGLLEHLLGSLGIEDWSLEEEAVAPYHPGRCASVFVAGERIGQVGEIHPRVDEEFGLPSVAAVFDVRTGPLVAAAEAGIAYRAVSRFPPVHRDLAFIVGRDVPAGAVKAAVAEAAGELLDRVTLFDVFEGNPIPEGKVSLAFSLDLRAPDRTLTDDEANAVVERIATRLKKDFSADLRTA